MMILKDYQAQAIRDLRRFLELLEQMDSLSAAYAALWAEKDALARPPYQSTLPGVPQVCFKVPTGGGKTFMAAASAGPIFEAMPIARGKVIVWLVPSDAILSQTLKNLRDPSHPYRRRLQADFAEPVAVYAKDELLMGANFSADTVEAQVSVLVLSYDSFRASNKEGRKAYRENGQMLSFVSRFSPEEELLEGADQSALIQAIRHYKPLVIIDESHHAQTNLSVEMLRNFNPCFVLELTATPKEKSNVITYVPAARLKAADMVKLPVLVRNLHTKAEVIAEAIDFRRRLEEIAKTEDAGDRPTVRPIVLFQAEAKGKGDRATFEKIAEELTKSYDIPAEQIAVKTAEINDLKTVDLMAADCRIRYIITVNALKEGWDCPFAYILASLANRSSAVEVEQIVGRVLRRPYTRRFRDNLLNMCYVFTTSADFHRTLENVVAGLNAAGFSEKDYRAVNEETPAPEPEPTENLSLEGMVEPEKKDAPEPESVAREEEKTGDGEKWQAHDGGDDQYGTRTKEDMETQARRMGADYDKKETEQAQDGRTKEERERMTEFPMQPEFLGAGEILLPQFFLREETNSLFGNDTETKLTKEALYKGFSLRNKDTEIDFDHLDVEIATVDIYGDEDHPRYKNLSDADRRYFQEHFAKLPQESQVRECAGKLFGLIDKKQNAIKTSDIQAYVERIVFAFDRERIFDAAQRPNAYARKINEKIKALLAEHGQKNFEAELDARNIFAKSSYKLPKKIAPTACTKSLVKSLYVAEADDMNELERRVIREVASMDNVRWWHRNRERKEFCINGFINHYPDFLVMMESGVLLLVETKGDDRDNSDSRRKLDLGKAWEAKAGSDRYGYFMVFDKVPMEGALSVDEFMARVRKM
ncbi:MAG: DEAD/DEAH box helicase family protein [Schwartzia sp.]|nr:DEAD/DEAH box helicase family protein [Schwartzia sp. (in: firmicutes)]